MKQGDSNFYDSESYCLLITLVLCRELFNCFCFKTQCLQDEKIDKFTKRILAVISLPRGKILELPLEQLCDRNSSTMRTLVSQVRRKIFISHGEKMTMDCWVMAKKLWQMIESLRKWQATQVSHSLMNLPSYPALAIISLAKFVYSDKATKFCEISTLLLSYVVPVKSKVKISRNFVASSEYMNFKGKSSYCVQIQIHSSEKLFI